MIEVKQTESGRWGLYVNDILIGDAKSRFDADHAKVMLEKALTPKPWGARNVVIAKALRCRDCTEKYGFCPIHQEEYDKALGAEDHVIDPEIIRAGDELSKSVLNGLKKDIEAAQKQTEITILDQALNEAVDPVVDQAAAELGVKARPFYGKCGICGGPYRDDDGKGFCVPCVID